MTAAWRSWHLFYNGDRDRLLTELVRPTVATLLAEEWIDRFFFVRFALGGPHVRLRLRVCDGRAGAVDEDLCRAATGFFARHPSPAPVPEEVVRRQNRQILAHDPNERDDSVYPDNSCIAVPIAFEIERYGGPSLLGHSLDYFVLSSVEALRLLEACAGQPRARQLPAFCRLLVRQAWGLADDRAELVELLSYAVRGVDLLKPLVDRGDQVFERRREAFLEIVGSEIARPPDVAGRRLSRLVRAAGPAIRRRIAVSQMHMTANRLGLTNADEVYLGRVLWRAAREVLEGDPELGPGAAPRDEDAAEGLEPLVRRALARMAAPRPRVGALRGNRDLLCLEGPQPAARATCAT